MRNIFVVLSCGLMSACPGELPGPPSEQTATPMTVPSSTSAAPKVEEEALGDFEGNDLPAIHPVKTVPSLPQGSWTFSTLVVNSSLQRGVGMRGFYRLKTAGQEATVTKTGYTGRVFKPEKWQTGTTTLAMASTSGLPVGSADMNLRNNKGPLGVYFIFTWAGDELYGYWRSTGRAWERAHMWGVVRGRPGDGDPEQMKVTPEGQPCVIGCMGETDKSPKPNEGLASCLAQCVKEPFVKTEDATSPPATVVAASPPNTHVEEPPPTGLEKELLEDLKRMLPQCRKGAARWRRFMTEAPQRTNAGDYQFVRSFEERLDRETDSLLTATMPVEALIGRYQERGVDTDKAHEIYQRECGTE